MDARMPDQAGDPVRTLWNGSALRGSSRALLGRAEELDQLSRLFERTVRDEGRPAVALVEGEAGIGKTRLVHQLARRAQEQGADVLSGFCVDVNSQVLPYAPVVELLTDLVAREGPAVVTALAGPTAVELARLVPALAVRDAVPEPTRASTASLFQAVRTLLDRLSQRRPLVVVVEDAHWADASTRDLVSLLAHQLRGAVLLVVTARLDEASTDPEMWRFLSNVRRRAAMCLIPRALTREEQAQQVAEILGVSPAGELVDKVYLRAEGNPFFAEEILALGLTAEVPPTVRGLLLARLASLSPATQQLLRAASVVGRRVPHRLLCRVSDVPEARLEAALRPAISHHVLVADQADGGSYRFRHALLQEAIASTCLPGELVRLHARAATALTQDPRLAGDHGFVAGRVARHWHAAGELRRALVASLAAAREAELALGFEEALANYERAVALLDVVGDADGLLGEPRYRLLWTAAEAAHLAGVPERAATLIRQAISVTDPAQPHHRAYLHERLGRYLWMAADGEGSLRAYERAMQLVPPEPVTCWRAAILSGYSQILMLNDRFSESVRYARAAIRMAQEVGDARSTEGHARNNLGVDLALLGQLEEGVGELAMARRIAEEEFDDVDDIARAIVNLHSVLFDNGRIQEAANVALEGIPVVDGLGLQRRKGVWCRCDAADALILLGRSEEALNLVEEAEQLSPAGIDAVRTALVRGQALLRLGDLAAAAGCLERARGLGDRVLDAQIQGPLYGALVEVATWRGDLEAALDLAERAQARLPLEDGSPHWFRLFAAAATAASEELLHRRRSRGGRGERVVPDVSVWVRRAETALARSPRNSPVDLAYCRTARAELSRSRGIHDPAAWADVAACWHTVGDPYGAAVARLHQAEALLGQPLPDRALALVSLREACSFASETGASHVRRRVEDLSRRARLRLPEAAQPAGAVLPPAGLTAREQEVLQLVTEGLTDRQIGARLFISHRTVERHVSNMLGKLGATRRAELVTVAHRVGLALPHAGRGTARSERAPDPGRRHPPRLRGGSGRPAPAPFGE